MQKKEQDAIAVGWLKNCAVLSLKAAVAAVADSDRNRDELARCHLRVPSARPPDNPISVARPSDKR